MSSTSFNFNRDEIKTLTKLDQRLVDLMKGKREFECPDVNITMNGKGYKGNEIEREFTKKATNIAMYNFVKYTMIGGVAGYLLSISMARSSSKVINVSIGTIIGSTFGVSKATIGIMRDQLELEHSPIAIESRYQLWKINPNHHWLNNHQNDVQRWSRMSYYGGNNNDASIDHNNIKGYDINTNNNIDKEMDDFDFQDMQNMKRQRFYENRKKLGDNNNSNNNNNGEYLENENVNDHLYDYERENRTKRQIKKNNHDQRFFHFESSQTDFVKTDDQINWG